MNTRKLAGLAIAVMVVFGLIAPPASAGVETGDILVNGIATVGHQLVEDRIPQNGECTPTGKGLHAPTRHGDHKNKAKLQEGQEAPVVVNKEVFYRLNIPDPEAIATITDTNDPAASGIYAGSLHVCGIVSPGAGGIGAACGSSTGRDGKGKLTLTTGPAAPRVYDLQNVSWLPAVGGNLPVYGHITRVSVDKQTKFTAKGTFEGMVNALPLHDEDSCLTAKRSPKDGGGRFFEVTGTAVSEALGKPEPKQRETKLKKGHTDPNT